MNMGPEISFEYVFDKASFQIWINVKALFLHYLEAKKLFQKSLRQERLALKH